MNTQSPLLFLLVFLLQWLLAPASLAAESKRVYLPLSDKISASADYYPGEVGKPWVMILHGFMQTSRFPTVVHMAESLNDAGYHVLAPTLSLNINNRKKSMACEAIHTHTFEQDLKEVALWANWLYNQSPRHSKRILIGHSSGALHVINYLYQHPEHDFSETLFLSIPYFGPRPYASETPADEQRALQAIKNHDNGLHRFGLSFCKQYTTTAKGFLSYYRLDADDTAGKIRAIKIPKTLIFGSHDVRIDQQWNKNLQQEGVRVIAIKGADHFFNDEFEFELHDVVESVLQADAPSP